MPRARAVFMALGTMIVAVTMALNAGTATSLSAGTLEPDCINTYLPVAEGATWPYAFLGKLLK
jgi:hypothetical protein